MNSLTVPEDDTKNRRDSSGVGILRELAPSQDVKKALECPICNEVPLAPIYTCTSGHTTCGKCRSGFRCGICKEDLSTTSRNSTVEMIVANSSFWCKYLVDGCQATILGCEYRDHVSECEFRKIECHEWDVKHCDGELIRFKDFFKHLKEEHEMQGFAMTSRTLAMSEYSNDLTTDGPWPTYYMEYNDDILLRNIKCENSIVYWWFTIIGSLADASRYRVKVTVYMKNDPSSRLDWVVPVYSVREQIADQAKLFRVAIPASQLQLYCSQRKHPHGEVYRYVIDLKYEILLG